MKAMSCYEWGDPGVLRLTEQPSRDLTDGELRIRVRAAGVNFADTLQIAGKYQVKPPLPFTPGLEISGEILEVGPGVTRPFRAGQRVLGFLRFGGGYADELVASEDCLLPIPDSLSDIDAGGFPTVYGTSYYALTWRGQLKAGETLLVLGAAGGVGLAAVEIGKQLGATVIAAAGGAEKCALTLEYGADHAIDYTCESIRDRVRELTGGVGADVVFDPLAATRSTRRSARSPGVPGCWCSALPPAVSNQCRPISYWSRISPSPAWCSARRTSATRRPAVVSLPRCCAGTPPAGCARASPRPSRWPKHLQR
jgi:NADPH2:quinone reductase